jgi:LPS export ABC transporter protein LptC
VKKISFKYVTCFPAIALFAFLAMLTSCENKLPTVPKSDILTLPSLTARDFKTVFNDSGRLQLILTAPIVEQYDSKETPYSEFRSGIMVLYFNLTGDTVARVTSKFAKYTKKNNNWELRDSVVVINEDGNRLETEVLNWDQERDRIYTDRFVKITKEDEITMGTGLESDSRMRVVKIKKVSAIIPLKDEQ